MVLSTTRRRRCGHTRSATDPSRIRIQIRDPRQTARECVWKTAEQNRVLEWIETLEQQRGVLSDHLPELPRTSPLYPYFLRPPVNKKGAQVLDLAVRVVRKLQRPGEIPRLCTCGLVLSPVSTRPPHVLPFELKKEIHQFNIDGFADRYFAQPKRSFFRRRGLKRMLTWQKVSAYSFMDKLVVR